MIMKYQHGNKIKYWVVCSMLFSVADHIYVLLDYFGVTKKPPQSIDPNFDKNSLKTFRGTSLADFILHILSCVTMLNNTCRIICLNFNDYLVQYHEMRI